MQKFTIQVTDFPHSDGEAYAAILEVVRLEGATVQAKVNAIRSLTCHSAMRAQAQAYLAHRFDRKPFITGPRDREPGVNKVWRLLWPE